MKTYKILSISLAALFACSCTEWLTVDNPTAQPIEEYFTTEAHLTEALVAAYDPLEWTDWSCGQYNPINILFEVLGDNVWVGGSDRTDMKIWHEAADFDARPVDCVASIWTEAYSGVKRCNDCIQYIDWVPNLPESVAKSYEAQCRVLRCFYYSWIWKLWGSAVYYETNLSQPYIGEQFSADEMYEKIMTDLQGAIDLGVLPLRWEAAEIGKASLSMAYMLYAELAMYQNDAARLPKALDYMKELISSGKFSLNPDYAQIWTREGEWCSESIFEINYKSEDQVRSYDWTMGAGGTWLPQLISPNNYSADGYLGGWGFCPVRTKTVEMFSDNDARKAATCMHATASYNVRYQDTGYFLEKYVAKEVYHGSTGASDCAFGNNIRYYRYSETLLNAAELVLAGYGSGEASKWLNEVHSRAIPGETVDATLENIKKERRLEFVGEGKRYFDLVRWGDAATVLVAEDDANFTTSSDKGRLGNWTESHKYLPIPLSEIDASNNTLQQNPAYN
ncbi:MAG: RagB/SusD family nutrient uptake outer membrane protein [Candidatus Cryptobacteroides sp.]